MPNKPMTFKRWELIAMFVLPMAVAIGVIIYFNVELDRAEKRITQNTVTNEQQNIVRAELVDQLRTADRHACNLINDLRTQNRGDARRSYRNLQRNADALGIEVTPEVRRLSRLEMERQLRRNRNVDCRRSVINGEEKGSSPKAGQSPDAATG